MRQKISTPVKNKGKIIIISAPSRAGKDAVISRVKKDKSIKFQKVVTYTTRPKRDYEINGIHYNFISKDKFIKMKKRGDFLEWATVNKHLYGTPRKEVERLLAAGKNVLLIIEVKGARRIIKLMPDRTLSIFLKPGSFSELRDRFKKDANFSPAQIKRRMDKARREIAASKIYDYVVINRQSKLDQTVRQVKKIFAKELKKG